MVSNPFFTGSELNHLPQMEGHQRSIEIREKHYESCKHSS